MKKTEITTGKLKTRWQERKTEVERKGEKLGAELRYQREVKKLHETVEKETSAYKSACGEKEEIGA